MKVSVTKGLMQIIPPHVARFGEHYLPELDFRSKADEAGLLGTVPYISTSLGIVFLAREASRAADGM